MLIIIIVIMRDDLTIIGIGENREQMGEKRVTVFRLRKNEN